MDLRTGQPLWRILSSPPLFAPLAKNESCEVAIVGAGITGAFVARELIRRGINTVVVDKRDACMGSTAACTALVQYEIDRSLIELSGLLGWEHAAGAYRACRRGLDDFALCVQEVGDCDCKRSPSLFLARREGDIRTLEEEAIARQKLELEVKFLSAGELKEQFGIVRPAALLSEVAYRVDPLKLTGNLLHAAAQRGARIYAHTPVEIELNPSSEHVLRTLNGYSIDCRHLVIASGYETPEQFKAIHSICRLRSTYALATRPTFRTEPWPRAALIWEMGDPYCYARVALDGRVIIGGEDEDIVDAKKRDAQLPRKLKRLLAKLHALLPELEVELECGWTGTFAQTRDGLPYIGTTIQYPGCYFALGYGGNGVTFSVLASQIIADQIENRSNPDAKLFAFDRKEDL